MLVKEKHTSRSRSTPDRRLAALRKIHVCAAACGSWFLGIDS
ncbi:MAG: hypothetical protein PUB85_02970 [Clostridia bacterium]|nr:hypothetical protein [Clostridia bacterium]